MSKRVELVFDSLTVHGAPAVRAVEGRDLLLEVALAENKAKTLKGAIAASFKPETLWRPVGLLHCVDAHLYAVAPDTVFKCESRTVFTSLPRNLFVHIKRYGKDEDGNLRKVQRAISFAQSLVLQTAHQEDVMSDPEDFSFDLKGIIVHSGVIGSGHCWSFLLEEDQEQNALVWTKYDDSKRFEVSKQVVDQESFGGVHGTSHSSCATVLWFSRATQE